MRNNRHKAMKVRILGAGRLLRPQNRAELQTWVRHFAGLRLPEHALCAGHDTPLDYLDYVFFERGGAADTVVWACRGGGKTMIGATATLLDLLFKPGIQVRILGGSRAQSAFMYRYLCGQVKTHFPDLIAGKITTQGFALTSGSRVEILTQSQTAVRGTRVQKMRCDEVELFNREVWSAAQLTTRSLPRPIAPTGPQATPHATLEERPARGAVEVFSTLHRASGLMAELVSGASEPADAVAAPAPAPVRKLFAWCIWDVIGQCLESQRACAGCVLAPWCDGRARQAAGFVPVSDVLAMHKRATRRAWEVEMLCHMPYPEHQTFPGFRTATHVRTFPVEASAPGQAIVEGTRTFRFETLIAGIDYGWQRFVCLWIAMLRDAQGRRVAWVRDEYVQDQRDLESHAAVLWERNARGPVRTFYADVAGRQHDAHSGRTSEAVLKAAGLPVKSRAMNILDGIQMINRLLEPPETWSLAPMPRLLVDPRCPHLIAALTESIQKDSRPVKDGTHDHLIDALRYALLGHDGAGGKVEMIKY